jgi:hypothetical protein
MTVPGTWRGVVNQYNRCPEEVKWYFAYFPKLAKEFPWDVSISYMFGLVELAHNMTLYCGVVKLHKVNAQLARAAIDKHHMARESFRSLFKAVFGKALKKATTDKIDEPQKIRNRILHGKSVKELEKRKAVVDILAYAGAFNEEVYSLAGFRPFGPLSGFKGRVGALDKSTSRWILKGIGFEGM